MTTHSYTRSSNSSAEDLRLAADQIDAMDLGDGDIETIYDDGVQAYRNARYEQAESLFYLASLCRPARWEYAYGLALSLKMSGKYEQALLIFMFSGLLAQDDFKFRLHAVECLLRLQRKNEALELLRALLSNVTPGVDPALLKRAQAWLQLAEHGASNAVNAN